MQRLNLTPDLEWIDLPRDVRVQVQPVTTALIYAARRDPAIAALPADADQELVALVMGQSIARLAIVAWEGIGDVDGNPIDPSPEAVTELMNIWPICRAFNKQIVEPAFDQESEKKDSAPSPSGSSAAARDTAKDAGTSAPNAPDS